MMYGSYNVRLRTYLQGQVKLQNVSAAATTTIFMVDNTDQTTPLLEGVCVFVHRTLYFTSPLQHRTVQVVPRTYLVAWLGLDASLEDVWEGTSYRDNRV
jgi:hypothetical protein